MTKRLRRSSSSSSSASEISQLEHDPIDLFLSGHPPCRTKLSGRYQSDIYTGLISSTRTYTNGRPFTRLEQLISIHHDDQIRRLLLTLRHHCMKHQWTKILQYLKSLLQSSFCRAYMRLYWQLTFRYLLEHARDNNQVDSPFLSQTFETLFHSPTINRSQAFYSYLCLHLAHEHTIDLYHDIETRYKSLPQPFFSGRCRHVSYIPKFNPKFEQLLLINLHFLYDYRQWLLDYSLLQTDTNPFVNHVKTLFEDERDLELWTFKLTTNFQEIQFLSNEFFDQYDVYLLKFLYFLYTTDTNVERIPSILQMYVQQHPNYINAYKYHYWFDHSTSVLKKLVELDPSSSPYVLIYCQAITNSIEVFDRLFDYLDYDKNRDDYLAWQLLSTHLVQIDLEDAEVVRCVQENWLMRKTIWTKFHFRTFDKMQYDKALVAYILLDKEEPRSNIRRRWLDDESSDHAEALHRLVNR